jgi:hypothetical protein
VHIIGCLNIIFAGTSTVAADEDMGYAAQQAVCEDTEWEDVDGPQDEFEPEPENDGNDFWGSNDEYIKLGLNEALYEGSDISVGQALLNLAIGYKRYKFSKACLKFLIKHLILV